MATKAVLYILVLFPEESDDIRLDLGRYILRPSRQRQPLAHDGKHVGKLRGDEIFGQDGQYLGEVKNDNRLITNLSKKSRRGPGFTPYANRVGHVPYVNYVGYVMYAGYEDFPDPSTF